MVPKIGSANPRNLATLKNAFGYACLRPDFQVLIQKKCIDYKLFVENYSVTHFLRAISKSKWINIFTRGNLICEKNPLHEKEWNPFEMLVSAKWVEMINKLLIYEK